MKVGIFGGSFNPVHNGHVGLTKDLLEEKVVEEVWIMPCAKHVYDKSLESVEHRVNMINLAIKDISGARIEDYELKLGRANYTRDTMRALKQIYSHDLFLIIGSDLLHDLPNWAGGKELRKEIRFIVINRPGYEVKSVEGLNIDYIREENASEISSTLVRDRIQKNKSIERFVPEDVAKYIEKEGLYKC